jgi:hypothetical protein
MLYKTKQTKNYGLFSLVAKSLEDVMGNLSYSHYQGKEEGNDEEKKRKERRWMRRREMNWKKT